jgi:sedoheptulose-bisphosphatase
MSLVVQYGPRTTAILTMDDGVYEFTLQGTKVACDWICSRENIVIAQEAKTFAPANFRASQDLPGYSDLIEYWMEKRLTLRYTGGLVPDMYRQFTKEQGIFANPTTPKAPAKVRIAFEAAPFALLVEKAGGKTSDGVTGGSILDVVIEKIDQRTPLCMGSAVEVERFNKLVLGIGA